MYAILQKPQHSSFDKSVEWRKKKTQQKNWGRHRDVPLRSSIKKNTSCLADSLQMWVPIGCPQLFVLCSPYWENKNVVYRSCHFCPRWDIYNGIQSFLLGWQKFYYNCMVVLWFSHLQSCFLFFFFFTPNKSLALLISSYCFLGNITGTISKWQCESNLI